MKQASIVLETSEVLSFTPTETSLPSATWTFNTSLIDRFVRYATALKSEFPNLKIYAFDSYIMAARGQIATYWPILDKIRAAEISQEKNLIDGNQAAGSVRFDLPAATAKLFFPPG